MQKPITFLCILLWSSLVIAENENISKAMHETEDIPQLEISEVNAHAIQGDAKSQYDLGMYYFKQQNYAVAANWLHKAASQGYPQAQYTFGGLYMFGLGVPIDITKTVEWYRKAAEQGCAEAQSSLGALYALGNGVPKSDVLAVEWYRKAAEQNYAEAQSQLGIMYYFGKGVPQDYIQAHKWLNLAAASGDKYAMKERGRLSSIMTASQIEEAQRLAREWKPIHKKVEP